MSASYEDVLRLGERVVCAQPAVSQLVDHLLPCLILVVAHREEGAVLVLRQGSHNIVEAALPLYSEVTTSTAQTSNGFKCSLRLEPSLDWPQIVFETEDIAILQNILHEVKMFVAMADDLNLHAAGRSHRWLSFYRLSDNQIGVPRSLPRSMSAHESEDSSSLMSSEVISSIEQNPFLSSMSYVEPHTSQQEEQVRIKERYIKSVLKRRREEYLVKQDLLIKCTTWNMAGRDLVESLNTLLRHDGQDADGPIRLYSMAFQEMDLSAEAYLTTRDAKQQRYQSRIEAALGDHYELVGSHQLVGILVCVYAHKSILPTITNVERSYVACGILGLVGNKGAVGLRFNVMNTSFAFLSCHLAAGQIAVEKRNADLRDIEKGIFNENGYWESGLIGIDHVFLSGDLNYRLELVRDKVDLALKVKDTVGLLQYDQLTHQRKQEKIHADWNESKIDFHPTYKFDIGTDNYDTSEKQRVPSWTDRILNRSSSPITNIYYTSIPEYVQSDHKPVVAAFKAEIEAVLTDREREIRSEAMRDLDRYENDATPSIRIKSGNDRVDFQEVYFAQSKIRTFSVQNDGDVTAKFSFIPKTNSPAICKRWLWPQPTSGILMPQEEMTIQVTVCIDAQDAQGLNSGSDQLYDVMILHVENGTDSYISIEGEWQRTCIGQSLDNLSVSRGVRSSYAISNRALERSDIVSIPKEISRICQHLLSENPNNVKLFTQKAVATILDRAQEGLDTDQDFDAKIEPEAMLHALCELLLIVLGSLTSPIIPWSLYDTAVMIRQPRKLLDAMPPLNVNVLMYLQSFLAQLVQLNQWDRRLEDRLCVAFGKALMPPKDNKAVVTDGALEKQRLFIKELIQAAA